MDRTSQAEETVRRYSDMVYRLAFARTGNTADAEDVYQEVFLRYLRSDPQFTSEEHRKAWLLRVTINCAKKLHAAPWRSWTRACGPSSSTTPAGALTTRCRRRSYAAGWEPAVIGTVRPGR